MSNIVTGLILGLLIGAGSLITESPIMTKSLISAGLAYFPAIILVLQALVYTLAFALSAWVGPIPKYFLTIHESLDQWIKRHFEFWPILLGFTGSVLILTYIQDDSESQYIVLRAMVIYAVYIFMMLPNSPISYSKKMRELYQTKILWR